MDQHEKYLKENMFRLADLSKSMGLAGSTLSLWCIDDEITIYKGDHGVNWVTKEGVESLIDHQNNPPSRNNNKGMQNRKSKDSNREHGLYHKLTNFTGLIPA